MTPTTTTTKHQTVTDLADLLPVLCNDPAIIAALIAATSDASIEEENLELLGCDAELVRSFHTALKATATF
jgi:hypothetical protein